MQSYTQENQSEQATPPTIIQRKLKALQEEGREPLVSGTDVLIYYSRHGDPNDNFNCRVLREDSSRIECRDYAYYVARQGTRTYHLNLSSEAQIKAQESLRTHRYDAERPDLNSDHYCLFAHEDFGSQLESLAKNLPINSSESFLFNSENHVMSITLIHKADGTYVIKFYDPNKTTVHLHALCTGLDAIRNLRLGDFLNDSSIEMYFPKFKTGVLIGINTIREQRTLEVNPEIEPAKILYYCIISGLNEMLDDLCQNIIKKDPDPDKQTILSAAKRDDGVPALYFILKYGQTDTITTFCKSILKSNLLSNQKTELLAAKSPDELPALFIALQNVYASSANAVGIFCKAILESKLPTVEKRLLLAAETTQKTPALFIALENSSTETAETIAAYCTAISESNAPLYLKMTLLSAADKLGRPGLSEALELGVTKTVKTFCDAVLGSSLAAPEKVMLLEAKDASQTPGLIYAIHHGRTATVTTFCETVLASDLSLEHKTELLAIEPLQQLIHTNPGLKTKCREIFLKFLYDLKDRHSAAGNQRRYIRIKELILHIETESFTFNTTSNLTSRSQCGMFKNVADKTNIEHNLTQNTKTSLQM